MALKILKLEDRFIRFSIDGITPAMANALRRSLMDDIPKLAIDKVTFHHGQIRDGEGNVYDSSLPLFDEIVAHRLSLVPLVTDPKMNFRSECQCQGKGCSLCTMTYSINKIGPATVTSGDLQPIGNPELSPTDKEIPIVKLGPKQAILVTAEAVMGRGKEHTKWQVTSGVSYKYHREFVVSKDKVADWQKYKDICRDSVVSETSSTIVFTDDNHCRYLSQLLDMTGVQVREDDTSFVFQFETDGSYKAIDALQYVLKRIPQRLNILLDSIVGD
ncbi:MAG TPA: DNA-directed RNA polymerase subunit D [Thermoplasmataceae archaeon]|nr:DNA-directed RNA polymerase subunit D [Thermoplasmatales archaeon AK]HLH85444.1 DNA-directed RNA polymerase subunit D [Thermoplasmataceae archaeon]